MDKIGPYQIEFYETEDGKKPIEEFLDSLGAKTAAKTVALMEVLEEYGPKLRTHFLRRPRKLPLKNCSWQKEEGSTGRTVIIETRRCGQ